MPEGRYGDGKTDFRGQKDIKNIFKVGGFKDRKTKRHFFKESRELRSEGVKTILRRALWGRKDRNYKTERRNDVFSEQGLRG